MKKSEMIKLVLKESLSLVNEKQVIQNLEILEKYGMLPPTVAVDRLVDCGDGQNLMSYKDNFWELEDET